jgi:hypothetical protein
VICYKFEQANLLRRGLRSVSEIIRLCSISFGFSQLHVSCHQKRVICISYAQRIFIVDIETDGQRKRDGETETERERETDRKRRTEREREERDVYYSILLLLFIEDFYI